ncbi:hypothetical protein VTN77DRAFT_1526 [Rasamsonia byssochlamydoides]|uniref:uncharacterized protein n=1 Tax=Rasamsonia byssochlamydoides TaxID=89139 RepID=UPI003743AB5D
MEFRFIVSPARGVKGCSFPSEYNGHRTRILHLVPRWLVILCPFYGTDGLSQIGYIQPDGSGYTCLTCDIPHGNGIGYLSALPDQKSIFFGSQDSSREVAADLPGAAVRPQILECSPSVLDCQTATILPVSIPQLDHDITVLQAREPRISPDGRHYLVTAVRTDGFIILLGDLSRTNTTYTVDNLRVLNPSSQCPPRTSDDWVNRLAWYEAKAFFNGNTVLYASTRGEGFNFDDWSLDLETGESTRLTRCLEWDEDIALDPSGQYYLIGSARQFHNQLRSLSAMKLPPFLDYALTGLSSYSILGTNTGRLHLLEKWIIPKG